MTDEDHIFVHLRCWSCLALVLDKKWRKNDAEKTSRYYQSSAHVRRMNQTRQKSISCTGNANINYIEANRNLKPKICGLSSTNAHFLHISNFLLLLFFLLPHFEFGNPSGMSGASFCIIGFVTVGTESKISIVALILNDLLQGNSDSDRFHLVYFLYISFKLDLTTWFLEFIKSLFVNDEKDQSQRKIIKWSITLLRHACWRIEALKIQKWMKEKKNDIFLALLSIQMLGFVYTFFEQILL